MRGEKKKTSKKNISEENEQQHHQNLGGREGGDSEDNGPLPSLLPPPHAVRSAPPALCLSSSHMGSWGGGQGAGAGARAPGLGWGFGFRGPNWDPGWEGQQLDVSMHLGSGLRGVPPGGEQGKFLSLSRGSPSSQEVWMEGCGGEGNSFGGMSLPYPPRALIPVGSHLLFPEALGGALGSGVGEHPKATPADM